jgi:hypothetical protein
MKHTLHIATISIAICVMNTGAIGQNVYRCGNNYSQKPCPDGVVVDVEDARTPTQKAEADAKTRREVAQVQAIEKTRQKEEAQQRAAQAKLAAAERKKAAAKPRKAASATDTAEATPTKRKGKKSTSAKLKKEPETFVAQAPTDKTKPAASPGKGK